MVDSLSAFDSPVTLTARHELEEFNSGEPSLDDWLKQRASPNVENRATRAYVVCPSGSRKVKAYYGLAMGQIARTDVTAAMRKNMQTHIPAVVLGRLAVDVSVAARGLGAAMLRDAVDRSMRAGSHVSARLLIVHAISPSAESFYEHYGFTRLPLETATLALDLLKLTTAWIVSR
jgi:GNAT superfamily N-acetyltransferase